MALGFDDLKERVSSQTGALWEQFQESSFFQQGRDKYENLSPVMQKLVLFGAVAAFVVALSSFPAGFFSSSNDSVANFEEKRNLVRDLLKVSRDANDSPDIPVPPDMMSLKTRIETNLQQAQLLPEQNRGVQLVTENSSIVPAAMALGMLQVSLAQLNLRQVIDLGYQIQSISPSVKILDMEMTANLQKPKYFDVVFKLMALNVPQLAPTTEVDEPTPKGGKRAPSRPKGKDAAKDSSKSSSKDSDASESN